MSFFLYGADEGTGGGFEADLSTRSMPQIEPQNMPSSLAAFFSRAGRNPHAARSTTEKFPAQSDRACRMLGEARADFHRRMAFQANKTLQMSFFFRAAAQPISLESLVEVSGSIRPSRTAHSSKLVALGKNCRAEVGAHPGNLIPALQQSRGRHRVKFSSAKSASGWREDTRSEFKQIVARR